MHKHLKYLLALAFLEGGAVMAVELVSAKLIGPYFGTSLYVWASVLGVTMTGLAGGYFLGGRLSTRDRNGRLLGMVLACAGLMVALMPLTSAAIMGQTLQWDVRWGSLVSCLVYLLPPVLLLGMVSPLLVRHGTVDPQMAGRVAGLVFAVSTLGGILTTFLLGFYGMSRWGLRLPLVCTGGMLLLLALLIMLVLRKRNLPAAAVMVVGVLALFRSSLSASPLVTGELVYHSEGVEGQVVVVDEPQGGEVCRTAYINRLNQTSVSARGKGCAMQPYVHQLSRVAGLQPAGSRVLLLGMGGGSLLAELLRLGHQVEGCELDARMLGVAERQFGVPVSQAQMRVADARVCINQMQGTFDLVVADLYYGDNSPSHVFTVQSLGQVRSHLAMGGALVILFPGPDTSPALRALVHTLHHVGFQVAELDPGAYGDTGKLLVATHQAFTPTYFLSHGETPCAAASGIPPFPPSAQVQDVADAPLLTDDRPLLEHLLLQTRNLRAGQAH